MTDPTVTALQAVETAKANLDVANNGLLNAMSAESSKKRVVQSGETTTSTYTDAHGVTHVVQALPTR